MMKRINITINEDLLNKIDSSSKTLCLSRSGFITLVLLCYVDNLEKVPGFKI